MVSEVKGSPISSRLYSLGHYFRNTAGLSVLLMASAVPAVAWDDKGTLTLALENDLFSSGDDRHYTHGTQIAYVSDTFMPGWVEATLGALSFKDKGDEARFSWSLGQKMFTPENISRSELIEDDRPYAGWLYTSFGFVSESRGTGIGHVDSMELILGVVGPDSGVESTQKAVHKLIDSPEPKGWKNQLDDEVTADLRYQREWSISLLPGYADVLPFVGVTLGSSQRRASTGFTFRLGSGVNGDYGPPLIRPREGGTSHFKPHQPFYWYLFAGAQGEYVDYNIFLDGNRDGNSHSVERREWLGNAQAGAVVGAGNWRLSLTNLWLSREFEGQDAPDEYGSIAVSYRF